jgi:hypothetical protein
VPRVFVLLLSLLLVLVTRVSRAGPADADAAIERGVQLREQGKDDQALVEFKRAYELSPTPRARAQMGLAEQALGQWVAADEHVREALLAQSDAWVESRRTVLEGALATIARHLGSLDIRAGATAGDVYLDGVRVAALPMAEPQRVEVGTRTLEVRSVGFYPVSRTIIVLPGETTRETIDLVPLPRAAAVAAPVASGGEARPMAAHAAPGPSSGAQRTLAFLGFGLAGASLATAFIGLGARGAEISDYNDDPSCPGAASPSQPASCASQLSAASTWKTVTIASFIGAGVLGAAAVTLLVTAPRGVSRPSVACSAGLSAVGCSVTF